METTFQLDDFSCELEELLLLRRLKALGKLWSHAPEDNTSAIEWKYNDLAVHLSSEDFTSHDSIRVRLLTAYNLAQVLRIRQFQHPYGPQLYNILLFLIYQLERVAPERVDFQKYQEKIVEILLMKDVITLFWNLNKLKNLAIIAFSIVIKSAHPDLSLTSKERMVKLVGTLVEHLPNVPSEIIQMTLINCQNKKKVSNVMAYDVTVEFIWKYKDTLAPAIGKVMFKDISETFNCTPPEERESSMLVLETMKHWMARLWRLHAICNDLTVSILKHLESSLYSMTYKCRYILILFLAKMFAKPSNVPLHKVCSSLWKSFLSRFQDIKVEIRIGCLVQVPDLFKIEDLRSDLVSTFGKRQMDRASRVRNKLASLVFILLRDSSHLNPEVTSDLSKILEDLAMDCEVSVRFSVLRHMAELYDFFNENERNDPIQKVVEKYPKYILEHYWVYEKQLNKERLTVIQLLNNYIVPYSMSPDQRMKRLLKVLATLETRSCFTLAKIKHQQHIHSKHLLDVIRYVKESIKGDNSMKNIAMLKSMALCHHIPLPFETALQSVISFARKLSQDDQEAELITNVLNHKSLEEINDILESLKANRNYSNESTWILELSSDWLFDEPSYKIFVSYVDDIIRGRTHLLEELHLNEFSLKNTFKMLEVLTVTCLSRCHDRELMCRFMGWFRMTKDQSVKIHVLKVLTLLQSEDEELMIKYPEVMNELILTCQELCTTSDTTMAKWCIRSLMIAEPKREELSHYLLSLVQELVANMTSPDMLSSYCSIYYLGYISLYMGIYFKDVIPDVLSKQVLDKVTAREESSSNASSFSFTHPSLDMKIKARYFKFLAQCAFEGGIISYNDALDLLFEVIENEVGSPAPNSPSVNEKAWMRLAAGCAVLRVLRAGSMDMLTCHQFYLLSDLMVDEVAEVAEVFSKKLRTALWCDYPTITMPPELLSLFILIDIDDSDVDGDEINNSVTTLRYLFSMKLNFVKLHIKTEAFSEYGPHVNEVLVYGLLALSHSKIFPNFNDLEELHRAKSKLKVFLNFLINDKDEDMNFYMKQVEMVKTHKLRGENEDSNKKLWTLCDIALLEMKKQPISTSKVTKEPTLPMKFFERKAIQNKRSYLTKKAIAALFAKRDQGNLRASNMDEKEDSEIESYQSEDENNSVVMVGEGNMTTEDMDDEMSIQIDEDATFESETFRTLRSSRKRKISEV